MEALIRWIRDIVINCGGGGLRACRETNIATASPVCESVSCECTCYHGQYDRVNSYMYSENFRVYRPGNKSLLINIGYSPKTKMTNITLQI